MEIGSTYIEDQNTYYPPRRFAFLLWMSILCLMWYFASRCETMEALDLHRYYETAYSMRDSSVSDIIKHFSARGIDFIYYVILHFAILLSIPFNLITALTVTVSLYMISRCMRIIYNGEIEWYVMAAVFFMTPITWVIEISRNMMAFMFLYIALRMLYKNKYVWMSLFLILSVFSHFSVLMYVAIFALSYLLRNLHIRNGLFVFVLIGFILFSYIAPSYIIDMFSSLLSEGETIYSTQYTSLDTLGLSTWTNVGISSVVNVVFAALFSILVLLNTNKTGFEFWALTFLVILLFFFMNSNQMFTYRCMMVMPMFWGLNIARIYQSGNYKGIIIVRRLSVIAIIIVLWHIWSYRTVYLPFV